MISTITVPKDKCIDIPEITVLSEDEFSRFLTRVKMDSKFSPVSLGFIPQSNLLEENDFILHRALKYKANVVIYNKAGSLTFYRFNEQKKVGRDYPGLGVGIIIPYPDNMIPLNYRSGTTNNRFGKWELPGGTVEFGASLEQTVRDEAMQEVCLDVEPLGYVSIHQDFPEAQHWISIGYVARRISGELRNGEPFKFEKVDLFPVTNLPKDTSVLTRLVVLEYLNKKGQYLKIDSVKE
jgi:8-oxo-dGTP diphosphatase